MLPANKKKPDSWQEALKFINHCPVCGSVYNTKKAKLFAQQDQACLIHINCVKCASNFIAMVVEIGRGLSSIGMVSDLNCDDAEKFCRIGPIETNEMIEGFRQIKENKLIIHSVK